MRDLWNAMPGWLQFVLVIAAIVFIVWLMGDSTPDPSLEGCYRDPQTGAIDC